MQSMELHLCGLEGVINYIHLLMCLSGNAVIVATNIQKQSSTR